jgi:hypothetical protein
MPTQNPAELLTPELMNQATQMAQESLQNISPQSVGPSEGSVGRSEVQSEVQSEAADESRVVDADAAAAAGVGRVADESGVAGVDAGAGRVADESGVAGVDAGAGAAAPLSPKQIAVNEATEELKKLEERDPPATQDELKAARDKLATAKEMEGGRRRRSRRRSGKKSAKKSKKSGARKSKKVGRSRKNGSKRRAHRKH